MSSSEHPFRVTIIGAGIIGLTTACTLLKEYRDIDNLQLTIVSETFSPNTTGDVSAGYWEPYGLENIDERTLRWAGYTYNIFMEEFFSSKADRAGIIKIPSYTLRKYRDTKKFSTKPAFSSLVRHSRMLDEHELKMFGHLQPNSGFSMSSVVVEVRKYLPHLHRYLAQDPRVKFIQRKIHSLTEFKGKTDMLVHCSGLAARHLVNDESVRPARGQVNQAFVPFIDHAYDLGHSCSCSMDQSGVFILHRWTCRIHYPTIGFRCSRWNIPIEWLEYSSEPWGHAHHSSHLLKDPARSRADSSWESPSWSTASSRWWCSSRIREDCRGHEHRSLLWPFRIRCYSFVGLCQRCRGHRQNSFSTNRPIWRCDKEHPAWTWTVVASCAKSKIHCLAS